MKKITNDKMSSINGGLKCIYHGLAMFVPILIPFNLGSVIDCWNNDH